MMNQTQKHTTGKKLLALLLALIMTVSLLPMSVFAAEVEAEPDQNVEQSTEPAAEDATVEPGQNEGEAAEEPAADPAETVAAPQAMVKDAAAVYADTTGADFFRILHLDCGRKYFTKDWIIALLYEMQAAGYNQLQLAFGNDGLRFLLDDMSFTANGTPYSHNTVVEKVEAGNAAQNSSGDGSWLTETEMDAIIAKANDLGIEIVPLLNLPGHANAILDIADNTYNASGSDNTLDVANSEEARNFGMAIFTKYVDYFAGKGCQFFNFGADEYANDISGTFTFSFSRLNSTQYGAFVGFINDLAAYINEKGMTPRAFNDGLYYNGQNVSIDTRIQCCYWSSGWDGYNVASAATISGKGHAMINTNGDFYYVLGKSDQFDSGYSYASNFSNTSFMGGTISNPVGSMFCIWCDYPNAETEAQVAANVRLVLRAMAARMSDQSIDTISTGVVTYGFNADGSPNTGGTETPDPTELPAKDEKTGVDVVVKGLEGQTATVTVTAIAARTEGLPKDAEAVSYNVTPAVDDETYTGEGTVTLPVPDAWKDSSDRIRGYIVTDGEVETITGTYNADSGKYTFTVQHFSEMGLLLQADSSVEVTNNETITVTVGQTATDTISGANYAGTYTTEDPSIATVEVTGKDATEATTTYTQASVTCDTLISSNSNNWTAASGYYYKADDGNYYPVYAKRRSNILTNNYTWGYSTTGSADNVTQLNTQNRAWASDTPNITVYTQSGTDGTPASTTVTFTGVSVGTTYVTVGNTRYTINVTAENLSTVSPLTVEYWITNSRITGSDGNTEITIKATDDGVATAGGVDIATLVAATGSKDGRTQEYWQAKILDVSKSNTSTSETELQTTKPGDDETLNGAAFTKVRYYGGKWQVYTTTWVDVDRTETTVTYDTDNGTQTYTGDKNQLVAYYMEVVDIKNANGTTNLHVNAADWGTKGDGTGNWGYPPESSRCSVSIQLVYEDGSLNPGTTTAADLQSKTIVYGYWSGGRGLGTMIFNGLENYQIYKVTAETGTMGSTTGSGYTVTVTSFDWDNNEETVWEGDPTASVSIGNPARSPSYEAPYDNLAWNTSSYNRNNAILIRVYVKSIAQADALHVNYFVEGSTTPFHDYSINVATGTVFDEDFARTDAGTLINNTVVDYEGITRTVQWDLSAMPQIGAQYRYSDYKFVEANRSEDGKTVNLYYTFNSTKTFVVDFGLPLVIKPTDMNKGLTSDKLTDIEINQTTTYANITTDGQYNITYKLKQTIDGQDNFGVQYTGNITTDEGTQSGSVSFTITIIPASNVYYEDSFVTFTDGTDAVVDATWTTDGTATSANQELQELGSKEIYGYDDAYQNSTTFSMGSARKVTVSANTTVNPTATFTFKGTGFDIISLTDNTSGAIIVNVTNDDGSYNKNFMVNNYYGYQYSDGQWIVNTNDGNNALYQIPVMKVTGLSYDQYTVTVTVAYGEIFDKTGNNSYSFWLDAIRVYDPMGVDYNYTSDSEGYPQYIKLRDKLAGAAGVTAQNNVVFIDGAEEAEIDTYANYGPNNEVYLANGQAISFTLSGDLDKVATVQIGAKAPIGTPMMNVNVSTLQQSLNTATEMYYDITSQAIENGTAKQVTITNNGDGILSLTNLKITFSSKDTVTLVTPSAEAQTFAVMSVRALFAAAPVEPEPTFAPERFEASWNSSTVRAGQKATLTIKTSEDVEAVTVDGVTIATYRTRTQRTGWGQNATKVTYREFTYTITAAETADYAITAVNAEGIASEPITATLTVQAASQRPGFGGWLDKIFSRWF